MNTIATLAELVEQLAVRTLDDQGHRGDSLLAQLAEARYSSSGKRSGATKARAERITLDLDAHVLWEDIVGRIESIAADWTELPSTHDPELDLLRWWAAYTAAADRDEVKPHHQRAAETWLTGWFERIDDYLNPPRVVPLRDAACPDCGATRFQQRNPTDEILDTETDALQITVTAGHELAAECLSCHSYWAGNTAVIDLAKRIGLTLDPDRIREAITDLTPAPDTPTVDNSAEACTQ